MLFNDLARSTLGADEHHLILVLSQALHRRQRFIKRGYRVLKVDDVDFVASPEDVLIHLGIPETGLMPEVRTCLQQVTHAYLRHNQTLCLGLPSVFSATPTVTGTRVRTSEKTCYLPKMASPALASGALYTTAPQTVKARPKRVAESVTLSRLSNSEAPTGFHEQCDPKNRL